MFWQNSKLPADDRSAYISSYNMFNYGFVADACDVIRTCCDMSPFGELMSTLHILKVHLLNGKKDKILKLPKNWQTPFTAVYEVLQIHVRGKEVPQVPCVISEQSPSDEHDSPRSKIRYIIKWYKSIRDQELSKV
jgi:hypothetical protein